MEIPSVYQNENELSIDKIRKKTRKGGRGEGE